MGARVLEQRDRVSLDAHLPGEDRGCGEGLPGEDLAPERERGAEREARVGMRRPRDELGAGAPPAFESHEEIETSVKQASGVEGEEDVPIEPHPPLGARVPVFARGVDRAGERARPFGCAELERHQSAAGAAAARAFGFRVAPFAGNGTKPGFRMESGS